MSYDAYDYNGDDDREFGPDPDAARCTVCGVDDLTPCTPECDCQWCLIKRAADAKKDAA